MTLFGVDYAWGRPGVSALKEAKAAFVCRYLSHDTTGKNLSKAEADELTKAGIGVVVVWESAANRALAGKAAGAQDAKDAEALAKTCGMPSDRPIYFAADWDVSDAQMAKVLDYLAGVASVLGLARTGLYGGYRAVQKAFDAKAITYGWQTYAWSGGKWDSRSQIQQYQNGQKINGAGVDYDRAMTTDYGQWGPAPVPPPKEESTVSGAKAMVAEAAKHVGKITEKTTPNMIQAWYNSNVENLGKSNWAWCAAFVSYCASKSGNGKAIKPRAYTVYMAQDFQKAGVWHTGTKANVSKCIPGDVVLFDWGGSDSIGAIDHVGIVEKNLGNGKVQTIEGNTSDQCLRRTRDYTTIAGYGRPKYTSGGSVPTDPHIVVPYNGHNHWVPTETLRKGDTGEQVARLQSALNALGLTPALALDGDFGDQTKNRVNTLKARAKLEQDGVYGEAAWKYLVKALQDKEAARTAPKPAPKPVPTPEPKPEPVPAPSISDVLKAIEALAVKVDAIEAWTKNATVEEETA